MASTIFGIPIVLPSLVSTPAKRTTRMMTLGSEGDNHNLGSHGVKSKSSPPPPSFNGISAVKSNARGPTTKEGIETILKMAAETQWNMLLDMKQREETHIVADPFVLEDVVKDSRIFCETYTLRSYDVGPNRKASIETLMNFLQETILDHIRNMGMLKDGLGSTPSMAGRNLIWVFTKMNVVVDQYPSWGDNVEVDNWFIPSERSGQGSYWVVRDCQTRKTLARANSMMVMMNKETRRLCNMPDEVRREFEPQYIASAPSAEDCRRISRFDHNRMEHVRTGLNPRWNDLDANFHVNNVKYIGLMLESVPISILETHEISEVNVEYRKECGMDDALQSLTSVSSDQATNGSLGAKGALECFHLLRTEDGAVVARGRTKWRSQA